MKTIKLNSFLHSFQIYDSSHENIQNDQEESNKADENPKSVVNIDDLFDNSDLFEKYARRKSKVYFRSNLNDHGENDKRNCIKIFI